MTILAERTKYLIKAPDESVLFDFDFADKLGSNTISASPTPTVVQHAKLGRITGSVNVTIASVSYSGTIVQARIAAGTLNEDYRMLATITDSGGNILTVDGILQVRMSQFSE